MSVFLNESGAALAVRQLPVLEHLQEDVEDVGVRLLDLVEEHDGEGLATHGLRELASLAMPDVAGRGPDQLAHAVALHVLAHVQADQSRTRPRSTSPRGPWSLLSCQRLWGPQNRKPPMGRLGSCRRVMGTGSVSGRSSEGAPAEE